MVAAAVAVVVAVVVVTTTITAATAATLVHWLPQPAKYETDGLPLTQVMPDVDFMYLRRFAVRDLVDDVYIANRGRN